MDNVLDGTGYTYNTPHRNYYDYRKYYYYNDSTGYYNYSTNYYDDKNTNDGMIWYNPDTDEYNVKHSGKWVSIKMGKMPEKKEENFLPDELFDI